MREVLHPAGPSQWFLFNKLWDGDGVRAVPSAWITHPTQATPMQHNATRITGTQAEGSNSSMG